MFSQFIPSRYLSSLSEIDAIMMQKGHTEIIPITIYGCKYSNAIPPAGAPMAPPIDRVNQQNDYRAPLPFSGSFREISTIMASARTSATA